MKIINVQWQQIGQNFWLQLLIEAYPIWMFFSEAMIIRPSHLKYIPKINNQMCNFADRTLIIYAD